MKRIIKVLAVTALMMVLMASSVSPAFAYHKYEEHYKGHTDNPTHGYDGRDPYWSGKQKDTDGGNDADKCVYGWTSENKDTSGGQQKDGYGECQGNIYN